jgi:outer membrane lipoprotein SlyB
MIDAKEHVTMTTVGALVGAALGAAIGGAALGLPGAVASMMLCAIGGAIFGSFM